MLPSDLKNFSLVIINPVVTIATEFIGNKSNFLCEMIRQHYITENDRVKFPKIEEFVYYSTASEMIRIMLHYKADPKFHTDNEHTQIITGILESISSFLLVITIFAILLPKGTLEIDFIKIQNKGKASESTKLWGKS
jgi:hypothetical protein